MGSEVYLYLTTGMSSFIAKVGGHAKPALRRAARLGDGWYGFGMDPDGRPNRECPAPER